MSCKRCSLDPWVRKISWRRKWLLTPVFLAGKFRGQRLAGDSPWGGKESGRTERPTTLSDHTEESYLWPDGVLCVTGVDTSGWKGEVLGGVLHARLGVWLHIGAEAEGRSSQRCSLSLVQLTAMDVQWTGVLISYENHCFLLHFISHVHGRFTYFAAQGYNGIPQLAL